MSKHRTRRIPKLSYTEKQRIGYHTNFRDSTTGRVKRKQFGMIPEAEAREQYVTWLAGHFGHDEPKPTRRRKPSRPIEARSLAAIGQGVIDYQRDYHSQEKIKAETWLERKQHVKDFLSYLNEQHGTGAVGRMSLKDLTMRDVEDYNRSIAPQSSSRVRKLMWAIKAIIDRAGRPEHGGQVLTWNWDSRDRMSGKASQARSLPRLDPLKRMLAAADLRGQALIWMGIGLGFGQSDLAAIRTEQIDEQGYDLRRVKTGIDRFGETPPMVWAAIQNYLAERPRRPDQLLFATKKGYPLVHQGTDAVAQWWTKLRTAIGETNRTLGGFYTLRHLGATEYGSRSGCSIGDMKRWLGHSASSAMADVYMKPIPPEDRKLIEWVRECLLSGTTDLTIDQRHRAGVLPSQLRRAS